MNKNVLVFGFPIIFPNLAQISHNAMHYLTIHNLQTEHVIEI